MTLKPEGRGVVPAHENHAEYRPRPRSSQPAHQPAHHPAVHDEDDHHHEMIVHHRIEPPAGERRDHEQVDAFVDAGMLAEFRLVGCAYHLVLAELPPLPAQLADA